LSVIARSPFPPVIARSPFPPVIARSEATKQSRFSAAGPSVCFAPLAKTKGERPPQFASLRSQRQKEGRHCEALSFFCHCEECNDEAISFSPRGPLRLLRCARKDERGKTPSGCFAPLATTKLGVCFAPLATTEGECHCEALFVLSLRGV